MGREELVVDVPPGRVRAARCSSTAVHAGGSWCGKNHALQVRRDTATAPSGEDAKGRFPTHLMVAAAELSYLKDAARTDPPAPPGVLLAPAVGGPDEPEAWYQTNETTREVAEKVGGGPGAALVPLRTGTAGRPHSGIWEPS